MKVGVDNSGTTVEEGDLVLFDLLGLSWRSSERPSDTRFIGKVVNGNEFGDPQENSFYIKIQRRKRGGVIYVEVENWKDHFEKINESFSNDIKNLYA